jgi:hypothetical protein
MQLGLIATPQDLASGMLALLIFLQITALGVNDQLLQSYASFFNIAFALIILNWLIVDQPFWKRMTLPFLILAAGLLWVCLPVFATIYDLWSIMPGTTAPRPVPDLQLGGGVRYVGQMAMLLSGAIIGYKRGSVRSFGDWLLIFGVVNLLVGFWLNWIDPVHVWGMTKAMHEDRFTGTLQNANAAAAIFGFLALLSLGRLLAILEYGGLQHATAMRGWTGFYAFAFISFFWALLLTASRTALVVTVIALFALGMRRYLVRRFEARRIVIALGVGIAALLLFASFGIALGLPVMDRMGQIGPDGLYRAEIYDRFWHLYTQSPLFGYGLNSFSELNIGTLESSRQARDFSYINAAHNQALQLLLAGGWPFLLAHAAAIIMIVKRSCVQSPLSDSGLFSLWLGLASLIACSMTDIALTVPAILSLGCAASGQIWGRAVRIKVDAIAAANKPKSYYSRKKREKEQSAVVENTSLSASRQRQDHSVTPLSPRISPPPRDVSKIKFN